MEATAGYAIPIDVLAFFKEGGLPLVTEEYSVACHLHLLLTTAREEYPPDANYGCEVWETEFNTLQATAVWMDRLARDIKELIERYEKRLGHVEVKAEMDQAEFKDNHSGKVAGRLKRRLRITVSARMATTDEVFHFEDAMLLAPFSLD